MSIRINENESRESIELLRHIFDSEELDNDLSDFEDLLSELFN